MARALLIVAVIVLPAKMAGQSGMTPKQATAIYLHAWYPEIGRLQGDSESIAARALRVAELAELGRFTEAHALLDGIESSLPGVAALVGAMRGRVFVLQYGDAVSAARFHERYGDVAVLQRAGRGRTPSLQADWSDGLLPSIHDAFLQWDRSVAQISRDRAAAVIADRQWRPDGRGDAAFARVTAALSDARRADVLSSQQEAILAARVAGALYRAEGQLTEAKVAFTHGLETARAMPSRLGELWFLTLIGDTLFSPFGDPISFGRDLDLEVALQGPRLGGNMVNPYASTLPAADQREASKYYEEAERVRAAAFPGRFEARLTWRRQFFRPDDMASGSKYRELIDLANHEGDARFATFLSGIDAGLQANRIELEQAVTAALEHGDALYVLRIFDQIRSVVTQTTQREVTPAQLDVLITASMVAARHGFVQTSGDLYLLAGLLCKRVAMVERSFDYLDRAAQAYERYLTNRPESVVYARVAQLLAYLETARHLQAKGPEEVFDISGRLRDIDAKIAKAASLLEGAEAVLPPYEATRRSIAISQRVNEAWIEAASCDDFHRRLRQLVGDAHGAGFTDLERRIEGMSSLCVGSSTLGTRPDGAGLGRAAVAAWREYAQQPDKDREQQFWKVYGDAVQQINLATARNWNDVAEGFVSVMLPVANHDPRLSGVSAYLRYHDAMARCSRQQCAEAAATLEDLLGRVKPTGEDAELRLALLYGLVDVEARRGDAGATLFALERLWHQHYISDLMHIGAAQDSPERAELEYLEKKRLQSADQLTDEDTVRLDFLRRALQLTSISAPAPVRGDLDEVLRTLMPGTTLLVYHLTAQTPIVVRASADAPAIVRSLPITPFDLSRAKVRLRSALSRPTTGWQRLSNELWRALIEPVGPLPANGTIVIAAGGAMSGLPAEALAPPGGPALGELHPIVYVGRFGAAGDRTWKTNGSSVVLGDWSDAGQQPSKTESSEVAGLLKAKPILEPLDDATLASTLAGARVVHVTAHNIPNAANIFGSSLHLRGRSVRMWKLFSLLRSPELVVLSGCETQSQAVALLDAFAMRASSPRWVIGAQWDTDGAASATFMAAFYRALVGYKLSPPEALMEARRQMRTNKEAQHPFYWGAFQVTAPDLSSLR